MLEVRLERLAPGVTTDLGMEATCVAATVLMVADGNAEGTNPGSAEGNDPGSAEGTEPFRADGTEPTRAEATEPVSAAAAAGREFFVVEAGGKRVFVRFIATDWGTTLGRVSGLAAAMAGLGACDGVLSFSDPEDGLWLGVVFAVCGWILAAVGGLVVLPGCGCGAWLLVTILVAGL